MLKDEVLMEFDDLISGPHGRHYHARACAHAAVDGLWEGWLEFERVADHEVLRTGKETVQPNRLDTEYWATGLTDVYLEGALERALEREGGLTLPPPGSTFAARSLAAH